MSHEPSVKQGVWQGREQEIVLDPLPCPLWVQQIALDQEMGGCLVVSIP